MRMTGVITLMGVGYAQYLHWEKGLFLYTIDSEWGSSVWVSLFSRVVSYWTGVKFIPYGVISQQRMHILNRM